MKSFSKFVCSALAPVALSTVAFAQCPADPSQTLTGAWTFQITAGVPSVGQFRITPGAPGTARATMSIIISARTPSTGTATSVTRFDNGTGSILYNANCTGGIMFFNGMSFANAQMDFSIDNNATFGRVLTLRNAQFTAAPPWSVTNCPALGAPFGAACTVSYPANASWGTAWPAPNGCPGTAAGNPSNLFNGTYSAITGLGVSSITMGAQTMQAWVPTVQLTATLPAAGFSIPFQGQGWSAPPNVVVPGSPITVPGFVQVPADCVRTCIYLQDGGPGGLGHGFIGDAYPRIATNGTVSFVYLGGISNLSTAVAYAVASGTIAR